MQKVNVRRVNEWDAPAMLKIYGPYADAGLCVPESGAPPLADYISRIDRYTYGRGWIMCEIDNVPAGICVITEAVRDPENPFVSDIEIYVKPEFQRRRVGTALFSLMRDIMQHGNRRGVYAPMLAGNKAAHSFFTSLGFEPVPGDDAAGTPDEDGKELLFLYRSLAPDQADAALPTKPYLIENADYEAAREKAALLVKPAE